MFQKISNFGRRHWRKVLIVFAVLALLHTAFNLYASLLLNRELGEIQAKGEPLTINALIPPAVPDAENAALYYKRATAALNVTREEESQFNSTNSGSARLDGEMSNIVAKNRAAIELAVKGGLEKNARFDTDWSGAPYKFAFPYYFDVRKLALLLSADARIKARAGDSGGALREIRAMAGMADHVSRDPTLIGMLVGIAIDAITDDALADVLEHAPPDAAQAQAFEANLPHTDWGNVLLRAMQGERTFGIAIFEAVQSGDNTISDIWGLTDGTSSTAPVQLVRPLVWLWRPWLKMDEVYVLRYWKQSLEKVNPKQIPMPVDIGDVEAFTVSLPRYAIMTRVLLPAFTSIRRNRNIAEVRTRQREIALALAAYYKSNGAYPPDLDGAQDLWKRPLPMDLYGNRAFVYRSTGETYLLYSVGPNDRDDQGRGSYGLGRRQINRQSNRGEDDITWNSRNR